MEPSESQDWWLEVDESLAEDELGASPNETGRSTSKSPRLSVMATEVDVLVWLIDLSATSEAIVATFTLRLLDGSKSTRSWSRSPR